MNNRITAWLNCEQVSIKDRETITKASLEERNLMFGKDLTLSHGLLQGPSLPGSNCVNVINAKRATLSFMKLMKREYPDQRLSFVVSSDQRKDSVLIASEIIKLLLSSGIDVYADRDPHPSNTLVSALEQTLAYGIIQVRTSTEITSYEEIVFYQRDGVRLNQKEVEEFNQIYSSLPFDCKIEEEKEKGSLFYFDQTKDFDNSYLSYVDHVSPYHSYFCGERLIRPLVTVQGGSLAKLVYLLKKEHGYPLTFVDGQDYFSKEEPTSCLDPVDLRSFEEARKQFDERRKVGEKINLIFNLDPSGEKVSLAYLNRKGELSFLDSEEMALLLVSFSLETMERNKTLRPNYEILCTPSHSASIDNIASYHHVRVRETGDSFASISKELENLSKEKQMLLLGYDSKGRYLLSRKMREADGMGTMSYLLDMAEYYQRQGKTLDLVLESLFNKYGYFKRGESVISLEGKKKSLFDRIKNLSFPSVGEVEVLEKYDYSSLIKTDYLLETEEKLTLEPFSQIKLILKDSSSIRFEPISFSSVKVSYELNYDGIENVDSKEKMLIDDIIKAIK